MSSFLSVSTGCSLRTYWNAMSADMVHEMSTLLTVLEVSIHEEHFFQILTMEGPEH